VKPARLLVVEDEPLVAADLVALLQEQGHEVIGSTRCGAEALGLAAEGRFDLATMDIRLGGAPDGIETAGLLRARHGIRVVYVTAFADDATLERAHPTEPLGYLVKPFQARDVRATLSMATFRADVERRRDEDAGWGEAALQRAGAGVMAVDVDGRLRFLSPTAERLTGVASAALRPHLGEVLEPPGPEGWGPSLAAAAEGRQLAGVTRPRAGAGPEALAFTFTPLRREDGPVRGTVVTLRSPARRGALGGGSPVLVSCVGCRKVQAADGGWMTIEEYLLDHHGLALSHGLCAGCVARLYPDEDA
jgi:CheY-like chemotaxis protein